MPCNSSVHGSEVGAASRQWEERDLRRKIDKILENTQKIQEDLTISVELKQEVDTVTEFLCTVLRQNPELVDDNEKLKAWWEAHQAWDRKNGR